MERAPQRTPLEWEHNFQRHLTPFTCGLPMFHDPYERESTKDYTRDFEMRGLCVGDLLSVTSQSARHQHLLNVFEEKDDPIQDPHFVAEHESMPKHSSFEILEERGFLPPDTWLLSRTVNKTIPSSDEILHEFTCEEPGGAFIGFPDGADRIDLADSTILKSYIQKHAKRWYTILRDRVGSDVYNGALFLLTGHDVAGRFFASTIIQAQLDEADDLRIQLTPDSEDVFWDLPDYWRRYTASCSSKTPLAKKTVSLRGFSIAISMEDWDEICQKDDTPSLFSSRPLDKTSFTYRLKEVISHVSWDKHEIWIPPLDVHKPLLPRRAPLHLSRVILERLSPHIPRGGFALVHDNDWIDVVKEIDPEEVNRLICGEWNIFADIILRRHKVMLKNGIVFLERRTPVGSTSHAIYYLVGFLVILISVFLHVHKSMLV